MFPQIDRKQEIALTYDSMNSKNNSHEILTKDFSASQEIQTLNSLEEAEQNLAQKNFIVNSPKDHTPLRKAVISDPMTI